MSTYLALSPVSSKGQRTKEHILDSAEGLFAQRGFDGVSMRDVAEQADIRIGLLTYHFPSKDQLFENVVARRATELNEARQQGLAALNEPTLERVLDAFLQPLLQRIHASRPGWRDYARLILHLSQDARWSELSAMYFGAIGHTVIEHMRRAEPGLTADGATRGYVYVVSVMMGMFAATGLLDRFSGGRLSSADALAQYPSMLRFAVAGVVALAEARPAPRKPRPASRRKL